MFAVQLFGDGWTDDLSDRCMLGSSTRNFDTLKEAILYADRLWREAHRRYYESWPTRRMVVAVFQLHDELGESPKYVRGDYTSPEAPWNASIR